MLRDDGDLIKGLGYVALYAAYLEEAVDECLEVLFSQEQTQYSGYQRQTTAQKIRHIRDKISTYTSLPDALTSFPEILTETLYLLEQRNLMIHGRVYAIRGSGDIRRPGRRDVSEQPATSAELYALANKLFEIYSPFRRASMFSLPRLLN